MLLPIGFTCVVIWLSSGPPLFYIYIFEHTPRATQFRAARNSTCAGLKTLRCKLGESWNIYTFIYRQLKCDVAVCDVMSII